MNRFFKLVLLSLSLLLLAGQAEAALKAVAPIPVQQDQATVDFQGLENFSVEEFLTLTPKQIREKTGRKLSLKEVVGLKIAQKKLKKELNAAPADGKPKSQVVALLLVILVGGLGIHRFYLGYTTIGIIQLLTLGGCGIWALIDLIRIVTGDLKPADGSEYNPTL